MTTQVEDNTNIVNANESDGSRGIANEANGLTGEDSHVIEVKPGDAQQTEIEMEDRARDDKGGPNGDTEVRFRKQARSIRTMRDKVPLLDFTKEVRAGAELKIIAKELVVINNVSDGEIDTLLETVATSMIQNEKHAEASEVVASFKTDAHGFLPQSAVQSYVVKDDALEFEDSWICITGVVKTLAKRRIVVAKLQDETNLGITSTNVKLLVAIAAPEGDKGLKSSRAAAFILSRIFEDEDFRVSLLNVDDGDKMKEMIVDRAEHLCEEPCALPDGTLGEEHHHESDLDKIKGFGFARGIVADLKRRAPHYLSDFADGVRGGRRTIRGLITTTMFLYFSILFYTMAIGLLFDIHSHHAITVQDSLMGVTIVGLSFGFFGGQEMNILLTTAPLSLFAHIVYEVAHDLHCDFLALYAAVGLFTSVFLLIFAVFDVSRIMKWATRCIDEILSIFVAFSLLKETVLDTKTVYEDEYYCYTKTSSDHGGGHGGATHHPTDAPNVTDALTTLAAHHTSGHHATSSGGHGDVDVVCEPQLAVLFVLVMLGTTWLGVLLYRLRQSPFLHPIARGVLSDQAIGITVIVWSFIGTYLFRRIYTAKAFIEDKMFQVPALETLEVKDWFSALYIAVSLSLLIFLEHNLTSMTVNGPSNKLQKGTSYHWDLFVLGILNFIMSFFGMPMVHAVVPHSPMHVRSMADVEEKVEFGYVQTHIVHVRETRLPTIIAHIGVGVSILMLPSPLKYIPKSVLNGLWIYLALQTFIGNQFFERMTLFFTEQSAYPTNHYVRRIPQKWMHIFTLIEILLLVILSCFGLSSIAYVKMTFPIILLLYIPVRQLLIPKIISPRYLQWIDAH
ncbi:solute carrier family 4 member 11-like isoform X2 [Ptychodera flava]|uniref:solute carrier family 4 member 11-like isoform X2 n=1 Tax=Ptychodera flava TaxID=63121 RepID=UPI00396A5811